MGLKRQKVGAAARRHDAPIDALLQQAQTCQALGRPHDAQKVYRQILRKDPNDFEILHLIGVGQHMAGDYEGAARSIGRAVEINPSSAEAHANLGAVLRALNRFDDAVASYDKAIALDPHFANAHYNRGNALLAMRRYFDAIACYERVLAINPNHVGAFFNRGKARAHLRHFDIAQVDFDRTVALDPRHVGAWTSRGDLLYERGALEPALQCYDKAIEINPDGIDAWIGAAQTFIMGSKPEQAMKVCHRALAINPKSVLALVLLAQCHSTKGDADIGLRYLDRAVALDPDSEFALSVRIFALDFASNIPVTEHYRARRAWWDRIGSKVQRVALRPDIERDPDRRLVLGYVSGDFRATSPAFAFRPVLQNHDKSQFEVVCYSTMAVSDAVTDSFKAIADRWRDATQFSDDQLAEAVQADKVDILIDLSGHTAGNRLPLFGRKPAPVQVTAWGHATGTGIPSIDYLFSDPVLIPPEARGNYAETIWDLPCAIAVEPPSVDLRGPEPPVLRNGYVTYGVFNRVSKMSDAAVSTWARVLSSDPTARLIMKDGGLDDPSIRAAQLKRLEALGVASDRVELVGRTPRDEHLRAFSRVDICLDTFPSNGGVSTWEAVYMGVPVVAKLGGSPSSRVGGAIMAAVGLPEFVAETEDDYVRIALGVKAERLQTLRRDLPAMVEATCGPEAYTKAVEAAYRGMWQTWCASESQP